jgi:glyoxylase-like metal-dependent hydrolase (beta-lactamase superfamily II)
MKKNALLRLSLAPLFAVTLGWVAVAQQSPAKLDVVKVKDDLYVIHNEVVPGNTTVLITNQGVLLVDDKFEVDAANVIAEVKKLTNQPIKYVVNTHHHADHSGSNAKLQAIGAQAVMSENARQHMVDGNQSGLPNITFADHANIYLGGKDVQLYYFGRGHTNGDIVAYFPAQRVLAAGDNFTVGDATPELIDYAGGGSAKELPATFERVLRLDFDSVVPGHGTVATKADMVKYRTTAVNLRNRVHTMLTQKKTKAEIAKMLTDEFHYGQFHIDFSLDGLMAELQ